jgi:hypothetical protein
MNLHFHGFWRMDWGFGDPNKTAALIVSLMFSVWGVAFFWRKGFWVALMMFAALGVLLVHTFSRGGIVAASYGSIFLLGHAPKPWRRNRLIGCVIAAWVIAVATIYLQANQRIAMGIADRSIANRLDIWKQVPKMIADAPMGWGIGNAVPAYQNWYQALERRETYLNLLSSHFDWLVEFNWPERILYFFCWFSIGLLCWPSSLVGAYRWFAVPLAIWVSFFVVCIFSHIAESIGLWILPLTALAAVLTVRLRQNVWPARQAWIWAFSGAVAAVAAMTILGVLSAGFKIRGSPNMVKIGRGEPRIWIVLNRDMMGDHYGKALRHYMEEHPVRDAVGIAMSLEDLPTARNGIVVILGGVPKSDLQFLGEEPKLLLLNPTFFPKDVVLGPTQIVGVLFGEFSQSPSMQSWYGVASVKILNGAGDFIASWPELVFNQGEVAASK